MHKSILALTALSILSTAPLAAQRRLLCEDCEPQCECDCWEHLFVERSQIFVNLEFLYWTVEEGVLDYAIKKDKNTSAAETYGIGKFKTVDYDWRPGYRVSLAWYKCPRYWELTGEYTWLYDKGTSSVSNLDGSLSSLINPTTEVISSDPYRRSRAVIDTHYHVGDLYVARVFDPNPHLRMRLIGGLTLAHIDQMMNQRHSNFVNQRDTIKDKWRFFGGGLRLGVRADWYWGCQFYLTGKTTFAPFIGTYKNEAIQKTTDNVLVRYTTYDDHRFTFHTQFILGPSWQVPCDCWSFELFAGYEFNQWFNLQERYRTGWATEPEMAKETKRSQGLYGLHGLTLRFTLGF